MPPNYINPNKKKKNSLGELETSSVNFIAGSGKGFALVL